MSSQSWRQQQPCATVNEQTKTPPPALQATETPAATPTTAGAVKQEYTSSLIAAATATALAVGGVTVTPLKLAALPVLVYMGVPSARRAFAALSDGGALAALLETAALGVVLVQGAVLPGAVGFSLYYLGRTLWSAHLENASLFTGAPPLPKTVCVRRAQGDMTIPRTQVQPKEQVIYAAGDLIAVAGKVVEGASWVQCLTPKVAVPMVVKSNDPVTVGSLVLTGRLIVQCA